LRIDYGLFFLFYLLVEAGILDGYDSLTTDQVQGFDLFRCKEIPVRMAEEHDTIIIHAACERKGDGDFAILQRGDLPQFGIFSGIVGDLRLDLLERVEQKSAVGWEFEVGIGG